MAGRQNLVMFLQGSCAATDWWSWRTREQIRRLKMTNARNNRTSFSVILAFCVLLFALSCAPSSTDTDPAKVSPTARLEVFSTRTGASDVKVDITEDDTRHPPSPAAQNISDELGKRGDLVIRATGSQLNKGLGKLTLSVNATKLDCTSLNKDGGITKGGVASGPGEVLITSALDVPGKPQGILQKDYEIHDYLDKVGSCAKFGAGFTLDATIELRVTVENVAGKKTSAPRLELPPVKLFTK